MVKAGKFSEMVVGEIEGKKRRGRRREAESATEVVAGEVKVGEGRRGGPEGARNGAGERVVGEVKDLKG